jgi:hypothetical protein
MLAVVVPLAGVLVLALPAITPAHTSLAAALPCAAGQRAASASCASATSGGDGDNLAGAGDTVPPAELMADSLFNRDVTAWPVARDSTAIVAEFNRDWQVNYGSVGVNGRPVVWVPPGQPMVPLSVQPGCANFSKDTGPSAPIPAWAPTSGPGDEILTVYQPSSDSVWELWQAHRVATQKTTGEGRTPPADAGWTACGAGKASLRTFSGVFPFPYGETASGISNLATEVTEADVLSGSIEHAIGLQVVDCTTAVYPADRGDCNYDPGTPAEGQWFRFAPSVKCADYDATAFENEVCIAGRQKGFVVVDHAGSDGIEADFATGTWTDEGNPGPVVSWQRNSRGQCCIFAGGGGPLEEAFRTASGLYEQEYQVIAGLPWRRLQVIVPPH